MLFSNEKIFSNSGLLKLFLLSFGVRFDVNFLKSITFDKVQENRYYYNISNPKALLLKHKIPSEILLADNVEVSIYVNKYSPFKLYSTNNRYFIEFENNSIEVFLNSKPKFFDKTTFSGKEIKKYASMYGRYILGLFVNGECEYIKKGYSCKFCSLGYSRSTFGSDNKLNINSGELKEILQDIIDYDGERIKYLMYTSGTYTDVDNGIIEQVNLIKIGTQIFANTKYCHHLTTMPPRNIELVKELKKAGLNSIAYDIEVFNKDLFKVYCPGKEKFYGYKNFILAARKTLDYFGKNNVKIGFIGGLEPIDSFRKGVNFFAEKGFSIAVNVFHPDLGSSLYNYSRPSVQYLLDMVKIQRDVYRKYNIIPVFPNGGRRSSLDTEVYRGFFDFL